jgi:hypothetical protein
MVSQIEQGALTPPLNTRVVSRALGVPTPPSSVAQPAGHIQCPRRTIHRSVRRLVGEVTVLGAGLFEGKIRAVIATLDGRRAG